MLHVFKMRRHPPTSPHAPSDSPTVDPTGVGKDFAIAIGLGLGVALGLLMLRVWRTHAHHVAMRHLIHDRLLVEDPDDAHRGPR